MNKYVVVSLVMIVLLVGLAEIYLAISWDENLEQGRWNITFNWTVKSLPDSKTEAPILHPFFFISQVSRKTSLSTKVNEVIKNMNFNEKSVTKSNINEEILHMQEEETTNIKEENTTNIEAGLDTHSNSNIRIAQDLRKEAILYDTNINEEKTTNIKEEETTNVEVGLDPHSNPNIRIDHDLRKEAILYDEMYPDCGFHSFN